MAADRRAPVVALGRSRRAHSSSPSTAPASTRRLAAGLAAHRAAIVCPLRRAGGDPARTCRGDAARPRRRRRRATGAERPGATLRPGAHARADRPARLLLSTTDRQGALGHHHPGGTRRGGARRPAQRRRCAVDAPDHRTSASERSRGVGRLRRRRGDSSWPGRGRRRRAGRASCPVATATSPEAAPAPPACRPASRPRRRWPVSQSAAVAAAGPVLRDRRRRLCRRRSCVAAPSQRRREHAAQAIEKRCRTRSS